MASHEHCAYCFDSIVSRFDTSVTPMLSKEAASEDQARTLFQSDNIIVCCIIYFTPSLSHRSFLCSSPFTSIILVETGSCEDA